MSLDTTQPSLFGPDPEPAPPKPAPKPGTVFQTCALTRNCHDCEINRSTEYELGIGYSRPRLADEVMRTTDDQGHVTQMFLCATHAYARGWKGRA